MAWYDNMDSTSTVGFPEWQLSGKGAICEPGRTIIVRFLPHPGVVELFGPDEKELLPYSQHAKSPFVRVNTHWYTDSAGLRRRTFCVRTAPDFVQDISRECDLCRLGVKLDRRLAVNTYIASVEGRIISDHSGLPTVRAMLISRRIFDDILSIITGQFGVGDITHPFTGRHVSMTRPRNQLEPWRLKPEPRPSKIQVEDVLEFLRSVRSVESLLSEAYKNQRIEGVDIDATLQQQGGQQRGGIGSTNDAPSGEGTNWF